MAAFLNFSVHFSSILVFLLILATLVTSHGSNNKYKHCSTMISCGKLQNVGYPFWGLGRPKYCGHPALQLHCPHNKSNEYPFLKGGVEYYYVQGINNRSSRMTIQLLELSWANKSCAFNLFNEFDGIFQATDNVKDTKLFYNCPQKNYTRQNHSITCQNGQTEVTAYYLPKPNNSDFQRCVFATVPVLSEELNLLNQGQTTLWDVLKKGYEVFYLYSSKCNECRVASGICGSLNGTEFSCFRNHHKSGLSKFQAGLVISGAFIVLVALNVGFCCYMKPKFQAHKLGSTRLYYDPMSPTVDTGSQFCGIPVFTYSELQDATNNFNAAQEIGHGSFGIVYFGKLRDGREVAVKRLYEKNNRQIGKFINEIMIFTRLCHQNLVKLYGCTSRHSQELLLVYEFISKGTVADHLHRNRKGPGTLSWDMRMKIATESASALAYLHASDVIHRDVKTNNILLDESFSVKVADFGLSKLFPIDATHVSTAPQGTPGYLDPNYNKCYQVTNKSDVYSFGVVLVELISSLPAVDMSRKEDEINLSDYAMKRIQHGTLNELVDPNLGFDTNLKVKKMITLVAELAFQCLQQDKELRPSMDEVLNTLKQIESTDKDNDYESTGEKEMNSSKETSKQQGNNNINPHSINSQHPYSPNSVMENLNSKSTVSNPSS